ncbi:MAG: hypothetical protein KGL31_01740 [candidate division NC10 bacterium]|nr:hypothetical protein [candidate division NC10 bacterium]MDE2320627.1 hypothetical protein [candidate division NC10 bacterium]
MNIRAGLLSFTFVMSLGINSYGQSMSPLAPTPQPAPPNPSGPKCCWIFDPTPPKGLANLLSFEGKIMAINPHDSSVEIEITAPEDRVYTIREVGGEQSKLLYRLRAGDRIKATLNEPMKMYHLEKVERRDSTD